MSQLAIFTILILWALTWFGLGIMCGFHLAKEAIISKIERGRDDGK